MRESALRKGNRQHAILRIYGSDDEQRLAECFMLEADSVGATMLVVRELNLSWSDNVSSLLAEAFDLTGAEIEVCRLLLSLRDTSRIADARNASVLTVRTQLRAIFGKTDTATQVDLMRLLSMLCARVQAGNRSPSVEWEDPYGHEQVFTDSNGLEIAYSWTGDPKGRAALFVHGLATGYALPADGLDELMQRGIKLYVISRPGFGNSASASLVEPAQSAAQAIEALARHLDIEAWHTIGVASGIIPLVHAAQLPDTRITSILGVASFLPFGKRETFAHLSAQRRVALRLAKVSPVFADWVGQVAYRMMKRRDPDFLIDTLALDSAVDREATRSPESPAMLRSGQRLLIHRDHRAFASDLRMLATDWSKTLETCPRPIHFLHGEHDPLNPVSRFHSLVENRADFTLESIPEAGELVYYGHSRRIVAALDRAMSENPL